MVNMRREVRPFSEVLTYSKVWYRVANVSYL